MIEYYTFPLIIFSVILSAFSFLDFSYFSLMYFHIIWTKYSFQNGKFGSMVFLWYQDLQISQIVYDTWDVKSQNQLISMIVQKCDIIQQFKVQKSGT